MEKESYKLEKDDFEGEDICVGCSKLCQRESVPACTCGSYSKEGQVMRQKAGYCPIVNRYASWRDDKPIISKSRKRVGQQKQR